MAKFQLNSGVPPRVAANQPQRVRMGAISVFALVVIICLAVLAVLSLSTANASLTMSQRQAQAMAELYLDEFAAQEFVASADELLARYDAASGRTVAQVLEAALDNLDDDARVAVGGEVQVTASLSGQEITAEFSCGNGRSLVVELVVGDDGSWRVDRWKMTAVQNEEPVEGQLLIVD